MKTLKLNTVLAYLAGFACAITLTVGTGVAFARISNPPSSSAAITAIGPTGQTSDGPTTTFATSTTGTDFTITGSGDTITFNIPTASASNRGLLSTADWTTFNGKESALTFNYPLTRSANAISSALSTTTANTWSALNIFGNASSTMFSAYTSYFGGSATTTIGTNGRINVAAASTTPQRGIVYDTAACQEATLTDGATVTWNLANASCARVVLGGNRTLDITNETQAIGQSVRLTVCSDASARSISSWDAAILWPGGTAPTQTATANKCDSFNGYVTAATGTPKVFLGASLGF